MPKSIKTFENPPRMTAVRSGGHAMRHDPDGTYVTAWQYDALLRSYRMALVQLQRAGQLVAKLKGRPRGTRRELTESECFMVEAAMYHGFDAMDDDATVFRCTQEQIVSLLHGAKNDSVDAVLAFVRHITVGAPWAITLDGSPESEKALRGIAQAFIARREGKPIPTMPVAPQVSRVPCMAAQTERQQNAE